MKKTAYLLLVVVALFSAYWANAQIEDQSYAILLWHDFDQSQKRLTFHANNQDFCDYYLYVSFINAEGFEGMLSGTPVTVTPGRHQILNYRVRDGATRLSYNYRYAMYRGSSSKKLKADFTYALPAVAEKAVTATVVENQLGYQLSFGLPSDTVYACRGGVMCDDNLKDNTAKGYRHFSDNRNLSQITVYHADGSFGEYVVRGKSLIYPGASVKMGDPIALAEGDGSYSVRFSTYFLDKNKLRDNKIGNKHTHFRPFFQTVGEGKVRMETGKTYLCGYTDEMRMQEMSRREKKKFLKNKSKLEKQADEKQTDEKQADEKQTNEAQTNEE
ncbi:MAG: hypothetical protein LBL94_10460 [Prevotellaceae bacterium]|jgi:hypothetical protein|nr:hypothetical protein [Prevotellaceae bacterium]